MRKSTQKNFYDNEQYRKNIYFRKWDVFIEKLCMSRIKWEGLPDTVDERFLERVLLRQSKAVFYNAGTETEPLFVATKVTTQDQPDLYDNYNKFLSIGSNWSESVPDGEGILIWDSMTRRNSSDILNMFAEDLASVDIVSDINRKQQRWGVVLTGNESNFKDTQRIQQMIDSGQPLILGLKGFEDDIDVKKIDLSVPLITDKLHEDKLSILSELYTMLGIINIPKDKPQYMNYDETAMGNDAIARIREDLLTPRQLACEEINDKYGLNLSVDWRQDNFDVILENTGGTASPVNTNDDTKEEGE